MSGLAVAVLAVRARMGKCPNPTCTKCDEVNDKLVGLLVEQVSKVAAEAGAERETTELRALFHLAVLALGGTWVVDLKGMEGKGTLMEDELPNGMRRYTATLL